MDELGLFPLGIVLVPAERAPLHIFEPRYRELIGECLELEREFGSILVEEEGMHSIGTRTRVTEVLERFEDGRLTVVVEGGERFRVVELTEGRSFHTAQVDPVEDETSETAPPDVVKKALVRYRRLARLAEVDTDELDPASPRLSFELASRVDFGVQRKQHLLEMRSEPERLAMVSSLLVDAARLLAREQEVRESASTNGKPKGR